MKKDNYRRYYNYSKSIPYSPNINLFDAGGAFAPGEDPGSSGGGGSTGGGEIGGGGGGGGPIAALIITAMANSHSQFLNEYAELLHQDYLEDLLDLIDKIKETNKERSDLLLHYIDLKQSANAREKMFESVANLPKVNNTFNLNSFTSLTNTPSMSTLDNLTPKNNKFFIGGLISSLNSLDHSLGNAVSGEYRSSTGDFLKSFPGGGLIGGLANRIWGIKTNRAEQLRVDNDKAMLKQSAAAAGTAASFDSAALNAPAAVNANVKIYTGGWAGSSKRKANRKNKAALLELLAAQDYAERAVENGILNVTNNQNAALLTHSAALGGQFNSPFSLGIGGALDYAFMNDYLTNGLIRAEGSVSSSYSNPSSNYYNGRTLFADGGEMNPNYQYTEGEEVDISEEELDRLIREGYQVEVINE